MLYSADIDIPNLNKKTLQNVKEKLECGCTLTNKSLKRAWKKKYYDLIKLAYENNKFLQIHDLDWGTMSLLRKCIEHNHKELFRFGLFQYFTGLKMRKAHIIRRCFEDILIFERYDLAEPFLFNNDFLEIAYLEGNEFYKDFNAWTNECMHHIKERAFQTIRDELLQKAWHPKRIEWCMEHDSFFLRES